MFRATPFNTPPSKLRNCFSSFSSKKFQTGLITGKYLRFALLFNVISNPPVCFAPLPALYVSIFGHTAAFRLALQPLFFFCFTMIRRRLLFSACLGFGLPSTWGVSAASRLIGKIHRGRRWTVIRVDASKESMRLFHSDAMGLPLRDFAALERFCANNGRKIIVAMNAGMFELDGSPVGWCVVEGKMLKAANLNAGDGNFFLKPNGVFAMEGGKAYVLESNEAVTKLRNPTFATQSGPLLLRRGAVHAGFKENSSNRKIRNAVGVSAKGEVWWAISEDEVSFHESATLFRDELGCPDALFLDGVVSRLHAPEFGRKAGPSLLGPLLALTAPL